MKYKIIDIILTLLLIGAFFTMFFFVFKFIKLDNERVRRYNERRLEELNYGKSFVGDTLVLFSDTLLISTYEGSRQRFGLSNGSYIDQEIIFKEKDQKKHE